MEMAHSMQDLVVEIWRGMVDEVLGKRSRSWRTGGSLLASYAGSWF